MKPLITLLTIVSYSWQRFSGCLSTDVIQDTSLNRDAIKLRHPVLMEFLVCEAN